ncbi:hypothetical protein ABTZ58_19125 [Streptomyces sp. NPDC094143]|uniref:hypothetical protein n=1 Tax=Streptomyces sp. NPDC094143 TaxID=3155310 RepID=UPI003316C1AC
MEAVLGRAVAQPVELPGVVGAGVPARVAAAAAPAHDRRARPVRRTDPCPLHSVVREGAWQPWRGDDLIREETAGFDCHVISDETPAAELSAMGLERHPAAPDGIQAWRRPPAL